MLKTHDLIIQKFKTEMLEIDTMHDQLCDLKDLLDQKNVSTFIRQSLETNYTDLSRKLFDIENKISYNFYILETQSVIENYTKLLNKPIQVNFFSGKIENNDDQRKELETTFYNVASKYSPNIVQKVEDTIDDTCDCDNFDEYNDKIICRECGLQTHQYDRKSTFKDSDRVNVIPKYMYDRRTHFKDCIKQFQGKQNSTILKKVYDDLLEKFRSSRLLVGDKNTPKKKRFVKITKKIVQLFLKETGHSKHYEDVVLIHSNITGTIPPDISSLEDKLIEDFDRLTKVYDDLIKEKNIERRSFINTQYVLFQLLNRHNFPVKEEEFNILKTLDRKMFHDDICKELFGKLQWNMKCLF